MIALQPGDRALVLYEYPFNEGIRTMLRLEHLFGRLAVLVPRDSALDHHFALATMFEIMDVASRADLKSDVLKELDRHRGQLLGLRGHPGIAQGTLETVLQRMDEAFDSLNRLPGKAGQVLTTNEWLMSIRSRISIPGGTCEFDLPAYYAWQHLSADRRRHDLGQWISTLEPLADALHLLLSLVRDSGVPHRVMAASGQYQQSLPPHKTYHLLRLRLPADTDLVPEISGHRLMVSVRLMKADAEGRVKPWTEDAAFELALCA